MAGVEQVAVESESPRLAVLTVCVRFVGGRCAGPGPLVYAACAGLCIAYGFVPKAGCFVGWRGEYQALTFTFIL